jgi:protein-tyrosine kinase
MTRSLTLLQQRERENEFLRPNETVRVSSGGQRSHKNLEVLTQEEVKLVQSVFRSPHLGGPRVVVFSGVEHGNGSSLICARTAETLADRMGGSVCVVDANLRSPALHRYFGADNLRGFTDMVIQSGPIQNFTKRLEGRNLWLLTYGFHTLDPQALLSSDRLRSRIAELRTEFDHVLIDAPPVNLYTDALLLGQTSDGVVLVVEANSTRRESAQKSKEDMESSGVKLLGAVLNKRTFPVPEFLYRKF